jgi:hypothetical protein
LARYPNVDKETVGIVVMHIIAESQYFPPPSARLTTDPLEG